MAEERHYTEERPRKRKKKKKAKGMPAGMRIGLIVGGGVLALSLLLVLVFILIVPLFNPENFRSYSGSFTVELHPGQKQTHTAPFKKGHFVSLKVANQSLGIFDVHVFDPSNKMIHTDGDKKNRSPTYYFEARDTGDYTFIIHNLGLAPGSGVVTYDVK